MSLPDKFLKPYDPSKTEDALYKRWEESGFFNPDVCIEKGVAKPDAEPFSIVLPPPNATDILHMGGAFMLVIEDIMVRYARMGGKRTLWLPGTDHAAIATESKVAKIISKEEGLNKLDLGREKFVKRVDDFVQKNRKSFSIQFRKMGSSLDWSREAFTLDKERVCAVHTAFQSMYDDGLIYRGYRIVNWDPKGQTTISDDEVVRNEETTNFYYFKYGPFTIGTARPETKFGDKYVVMHPDDKRYEAYKHRQSIDLEWINGPITATVIKDDAIDMEFGTGVMTITPAHSQIDFEIAERHKLDKEQIIDFRGKLLHIAGEFEGMKIEEAREKIVEKLKKKGLFVKVDDSYTHQKATADRTSGIVEPQIMQQWFIDVNKKFSIPHSNIKGVKTGEKVTLKELMLHVVKEKSIKILPERFEKTYFNWIENLRDWNISRQIWYGHQIPVWYREKEIHVGVDAPKEKGWTQDPDTLDTWFSSGLWTFSTLGWPKKTKDLKTYHPTSVLETAYDILFFWVARMILMSTYHLGEIPFKTVYLHGLVRDEKGQKISKSLGDNIDPVDMINKYGADAVRMSLVVGVGPGQDSKISENKIRSYKKFANKIWNVARFVLSSTEEFDVNEKPSLSDSNKERLKELDSLILDVDSDMEHYRLYLAAEKLYHYFWHTFADVIIEEQKERLQNGREQEKQSAQWMMLEILKTTLRLLHPFMPFVTEEIWSHMPNKETELLLVAPWPQITRNS